MKLKPNYYLFGGKGAVWSETTHIASNFSSTTLCGKPMLSSNHSEIQGIKKPGCKECISIHDV
jgi:hypothetical protein